MFREGENVPKSYRQVIIYLPDPSVCRIIYIYMYIYITYYTHIICFQKPNCFRCTALNLLFFLNLTHCECFPCLFMHLPLVLNVCLIFCLFFFTISLFNYHTDRLLSCFQVFITIDISIIIILM